MFSCFNLMFIPYQTIRMKHVKYVKFPVEQKTHCTEAEASNSSNHASCGLCHLEAVVGVALVATWRQLCAHCESSLDFSHGFCHDSWSSSRIIVNHYRLLSASLGSFVFLALGPVESKELSFMAYHQRSLDQTLGLFPDQSAEKVTCNTRNTSLRQGRVVVWHFWWRCHFEIRRGINGNL